MNRLLQRTLLRALLPPVLGAACACDGPVDPAAGAGTAPQAPAPTNRIPIPSTVRANLGIRFARVEARAVAHTLRVPGRFELHPAARREHRAPLGGRIEPLVEPYARIAAGAPLYRIDSSDWRELHERIAATRARVESMGPLREAHRVHERSLADKVTLWKARLVQLEELRQAGGGSAAELTEARGMLNTTEAEHADQMEKDALLEAEQRQLEAELRAHEARRAQLLRAAGAPGATDASTNGAGAGGALAEAADYVVHAAAGGVVVTLDVTPGGLVDEHSLVLTTVAPEQLLFRARALQSDLGRLRDGLPATVVPPIGGSIAADATMTGALRLAPIADAEALSIELLVQPTALAEWARAGVAAHLEITLMGGSVDLAIPISAVVRDGARPIVFRRDPANAEQVIRQEADLGLADGRWIAILSGVKEGDEVVVSGNYQLMLASGGATQKGGHFHPDGTFHAGEE
jgi:cobalt-zinc-cadmium efflux system membrane fusion protein